MRTFLLGAATLALAATGAIAKPDKGNDNHGDHGKAHVSAKAEVRGPVRVEARGNARVEARGNDHRAERRDDRREVRRDDHPRREAVRQVERREDRREDRRDNRRENRYERRDDGARVVRVEDRRFDDRDGRYFDREDYARQRVFFREDGRRALIAGCPPGLAKKHNGCMPPGLAKRDDRDYFRYDWQPRLFGLRNYDRGTYYYRDGYLMRYGSNNLISGYIPLLGGALAIGNAWPVSYRSYEVPQYYVDYYDLGPANSYRYADNVIYRVDPEDAAIMSVAALLTGDDFTIGQPMPIGYDVYNVPYAYRDRYYDTPEAMYRYSDGYVYQIDPKTQLIAAAINLLV